MATSQEMYNRIVHRYENDYITDEQLNRYAKLNVITYEEARKIREVKALKQGGVSNA